MNELSNKYKMNFPKGASTLVDEFTKSFIEKFGVNELRKVAKINFKNAQRI